MEHSPTTLPPSGATRPEIESRLQLCPRLPSLSSVNSSLRELLNADHRNTSQVADIIRRDPSLAARLLRLANSVYYGSPTPITSIEEAIFFLGIRQIRQWAMVTPIIEDCARLTGRAPFTWPDFWQHCIATAVLTSEIVKIAQPSLDEVEYIAGLLHDIGKIVMATALPDFFVAIYGQDQPCHEDPVLHEISTVGMHHGEIGALYLERHHLPDLLVAAARWHHHPADAPTHTTAIAAVQIANLLAQCSGIGSNGSRPRLTGEEWREAEGWKLICRPESNDQKERIEARLMEAVENLPILMKEFF